MYKVLTTKLSPLQFVIPFTSHLLWIVLLPLHSPQKPGENWNILYCIPRELLTWPKHRLHALTCCSLRMLGNEIHYFPVWEGTTLLGNHRSRDVWLRAFLVFNCRQVFGSRRRWGNVHHCTGRYCRSCRHHFCHKGETGALLTVCTAQFMELTHG